MQRLSHLWLRLTNSYWLIPSLFAFGSVVLAVGAALIDGWLADDWPDALLRFFAVTVDGATSLLDTIAGSMITVAGVTFSVTMVALSTASANYGPQLLEGFRRDRTSQITLGVFIGTFLYCLLLMRVVVPESDSTARFVPRLGVALAVVFALASVAVLITFVHHVVEMLSISSLVARVGTQLCNRITSCFARLDEDADDEDEGCHDGDDGVAAHPKPWRSEDAELEFEAWPWQVLAARSGYIERIDRDVLYALGADHGLRLALYVRTGEFVHDGMRIASLTRAGDTAPAPLPDAETRRALERRVERALVFGSKRTTVDDIELLVGQLIEVTQRALSPGINDPAVAIGAIDWLGAAMHELSRRRVLRRDARPGQLLEPVRDFDDYCVLIYGSLRRDISASRNAALHTLEQLARLALEARAPRRRARLVRELHHLLSETLAATTSPVDAALLRERVATALARLERRHGGAQP